MMPRQLPLDLKWRSHASFGNFITGRNAEVVDRVRAAALSPERSCLLLWGLTTSGKTHLVESALQEASQQDRRVVYLPLRQAQTLEPAWLEGLDTGADLICIDDIDAVAGNLDWERALFALYVQCDRCSLIMSAALPPASAGFRMPELVTRLAGGLVYQVQPLDDAGKRKLLEQRAHELGLVLEPSVSRYLLERYARDLGELMALLDRIDAECLRAQRRPTVTLIRGLEP